MITPPLEDVTCTLGKGDEGREGAGTIQVVFRSRELEGQTDPSTVWGSKRLKRRQKEQPPRERVTF